ncbi:MAG: GreA/GreB family elongation factor [Bacilli bacterium]|nr:GreA/GreB family elongation factor [Bacilli bacterium]
MKYKITKEQLENLIEYLKSNHSINPDYDSYIFSAQGKIAGDGSFESPGIDVSTLKLNDYITFCQTVLANYELIADFNDGTVHLGSTVAFKANGVSQKRTVIGIILPSDNAREFITVASPIGAALVGHKQGDTIVVLTPNGEISVFVEEIVKIREEEKSHAL